MRIYLSVIIGLLFFACDSNDSSDGDALSKDFSSPFVVKELKQKLEYTLHPENNTEQTSTFIYEGDQLVGMEFKDTEDNQGKKSILRDKAGNIIKVETYFMESNDLVLKSYDEYIYTKGHLSQMKRYTLYENNFVLINTVNFEYNNQGQLIKQEVLTGTGKPDRILTYEYSDESTNPSKILRELALSGTKTTSIYEYELTDSPLVMYLLISSYPDFALVKKNIKRIKSPAQSDPQQEEVVADYTYEYDDQGRPTEIGSTTSAVKETIQIKY